MRNWSLLARIVPCFIVLLLAAHVSAIPPMPTEFYGSVVIDGKPAPIGTNISAQINGVDKGSIKTIVDGFYGGPGIFDDRLKVYVNEEEYRPGELKIVFLINGQKASQTVDYEPGISKQLDLSTGAGAAIVEQPVGNITPAGTIIPLQTPVQYGQGGNESYSPSVPSSTGTGSAAVGQPVGNFTSTGPIVPLITPNQNQGENEPYTSSGPSSSGSTTVSYGLDQERTFKAEDGLAEVKFAKDTMLFSPEGQFLNAVGLRTRGVSDLPPFPTDKNLKFTGYAYEIIPQGTYFNPKGILTMKLPPDRAYAIIQAGPVIYEFLSQTATWEPVRTSSNVFTNEITGDIFEAAIYALLIPTEAGSQNKTTINTPASLNNTTSSGPSGGIQTVITPLITPQPVITPQAVITPGGQVGVPTIAPTVPVITPLSTIRPEGSNQSVVTSPVASRIPGLGLIITTVSALKSKMTGPVLAVTGVFIIFILINAFVYAIYRYWWQQRKENG